MAEAEAERLQNAMAMKPHRVQLRRTKGWRMPPNTVSVARPTRWGNPWRIGGRFHEAVIGGDPWSFRELRTATDVVQCYREAMAMPDHDAFKEAIRANLRGKNLACFCPLDQPCHADVLLELANR